MSAKKCSMCGKVLKKNQKSFCSRNCFYQFQIKKIDKKCSYCNKIGKWKRSFCSHKCYSKWSNGRPNNSNTKFKKGQIPWNKGMKANKEWYEKMTEAGFLTPKYGVKSGNWKGGVTITKEKLRERQKLYRQNPKTKLKRQIYESKRNALKKSTADDTVTYEAIKKMFKEQNGKCVICYKELNKYHIDHIIPLTKKGKHTIINIQLLCPRCNIIKYNHLILSN